MQFLEGYYVVYVYTESIWLILVRIDLELFFF